MIAKLEDGKLIIIPETIEETYDIVVYVSDVKCGEIACLLVVELEEKK